MLPPSLRFISVKFVCQEIVSDSYNFLTFVGSELNHAPIASAVFAAVPKIKQVLRIANSEADEYSVPVRAA